MKRYVFDLNEYQRDNLLWLLDIAKELGLDSGDWLEQIRYLLWLDDGPGNPEVDIYETEAILKRTGPIR